MNKVNFKSPEELAKQRKRDQSPARKLWRKAYLQSKKTFIKMTPEEKKEKTQSPEAKEYRRAYYETRKQNPEYKEYVRNYQKSQKFKEYRRLIKKEKMKNDPSYAIICGFRSRLSLIARGKTKKTMDLVGCSKDEFKLHIESQFRNGMTWDNYGKYWHVDHILPCSSFDHTESSQVSQCWHWTNLRPLEAKENLTKGDQITEPQMSLLFNWVGKHPKKALKF
jgi:hypothetical protein